MSDTLTTLEQGARVLHTPCGGGPLVWHVWGEGPPLLLLHGGSGSWTHWVRNVAPLAASGRSLWVPDMPGFGDSALPPGCEDADQLPPWLEQGLQQLLGDTPVDVLAFSFGALVAGYLATAHPERVASLLLIGAPALSAEALPPLPLLLWQRHPPGPARDAAHRRNLRLLMLAHDDAVDELALAVHAANVARDRMLRRKLMRTDALLRLLPGLRCPLAGWWGDQDVLYAHRLPVIGQALSRAPHYRGLTLRPGVGHWAMYEDAAAFNAGAVSWLDGLSR
jgi:2-hydroxy-6-oxonona-2,4-dienedioate hydrolase